MCRVCTNCPSYACVLVRLDHVIDHDYVIRPCPRSRLKKFMYHVRVVATLKPYHRPGTMKNDGTTSGSLSSDSSSSGYSRRSMVAGSLSSVRSGAMRQLQDLSDDLERKSAVRSAQSSLYAESWDANVPYRNNKILLSDDVKLGLAVQLSAAGVPGAFTSTLPGSNAPKPPILLDSSSGTRDMDDSAFSESAVSIEFTPIADLQMRMNTFRLQTWKEESARKEIDVRQRKRVLFGTGIAFLVLVAIIVGATLGALRARSQDQKVPEPASQQPFERCYSSNDAAVSERYDEFRSAIVLEFPDMETEIDTPLSAPNAALCWLSMYDEFPLEITGKDKSALDVLVQRFAVVTIFYRFQGTAVMYPQGNHFVQWLSSSDVCQWNLPIICSNREAPGVVTDLYFKGMNVLGTIPSEISMLSNLTRLEFEAVTFLSGEIPTGLWHLTLLEGLIIPAPGINGSLPDDLGNLSQLTELNLYTADFSGTIPELSTLTKLTSLLLGSNNFEGPIPSLGALTNLGKSSPMLLHSSKACLTLCQVNLMLGTPLIVATFPSDLWSLTQLRTCRMPRYWACFKPLRLTFSSQGICT